MRILFLIVAIFAMVLGFLLLFAPRLFVRASTILNRIIATDEVILSRRLVFGVFLIGAGIYMIYLFTQSL